MAEDQGVKPKTQVIYKLFFALLATICLLPEQGYARTCKPHHLFLGGDVFGFNLNTSVYDCKIQGARTFYGIAFGYDYLKLCRPYVGFNLFSGGTSHQFSAHHGGQPLLGSRGETYFGYSEFRLGYTFSPHRCWYSSPFLGIGGYIIDLPRHATGFEEMLPYVAVGAKTRVTLGPCQTLGINCKVFCPFHASQTIRVAGEKRLVAHYHRWGAEVGIPYTLTLGRQQRWSFQIEPFFLTLDIAGTQDIYGGRLSVRLAL